MNIERDPDIRPELTNQLSQPTLDNEGGFSMDNQNTEREEEGNARETAIRQEVPERSGAEGGRRGERNASAEHAFLRDFNSHLLKPDVQNLLSSPAPVFYETGGTRLSDDVKEFVEFIERIDPSDKDILIFANAVSSPAITVPGPTGQEPVTINLSPEVRKLLYEWAVEKVISIPERNPEGEYALSFELQNIRDKLKAHAITAFEHDPNPRLRGFAEHIATLIDVKQVFHGMRISLNAGLDEYKKGLAHLRTHGLHFVNNDVPGVMQALNELERSFLRKVSENNGKGLKTKQSTDAIKRAEEMVRGLWERGLLKDGERLLTRWEMERAVKMALVHFQAMQRSAIYIGAGEIPGIYESFHGEYQVRTVLPAKALWWRFWWPAGNKPASRELLDRTIEAMKRQWDGKLSHEEDKRRKNRFGQSNRQNIDSLMGLSRDEMLKNYLGIFDIASHNGVRGPKLYFSPIKLEDGRTMYDFLDATESMDKISDPELLAKIENYILGQTSYLSALNRSAKLSTELRTRLWQKRAIIDPLAVAYLRPEILEDLTAEENEAWGEMVRILDEHHILRLQEEKEKYSRVLTDAELASEADRYRRGISNDTKYQILSSGFVSQRLGEFSGEKRSAMAAVLRKIIDRGVAEAEYLAITTPVTRHNYAIDDTPIVAWYDEGGEALNDNNFVRNFGDQATLQEKGYTVLGSVFNDPRAGLSGQPFDESFAGFASVFGDGPSRELIQGSMEAWLEMATQNRNSKWMGPEVLGARKKPNSPMEQYFGNVGLYLNEDQIAGWLEGRALKGSVENDLSKPRNERQLELLKKDLKADRRAKLIAVLRNLVLILPPSFLIPLFKVLGISIKEGFKDQA